MHLAVYVPFPGTIAARTVASGSAIVGRLDRINDGLADCHYEGAVLGQKMLYADKLLHAAGRLAASYPTTARAAFAVDELQQVATYDVIRSAVVDITGVDALEEWSGETVEAIRGRILPQGEVSWKEAASLDGELRPLQGARHTPDAMLYKTRAGQVVLFQPAAHAAVVYDHDSGELAALLSSLNVGDEEIQRVTGNASGAAGWRPHP